MNKKNTFLNLLLLVCLLWTSNMTAQTTPDMLSCPAGLELSYNSCNLGADLDAPSAATVATGAVACTAGGITSDNAYIRNYTISEDMDIQNICFGVETAVSGDGTGTQPAFVTIYDGVWGGTVLATESIIISDQTLSVECIALTTPLTVTVGDVIVLEFFIPDSDVHTFFMGSNPGGEDCTSFIVSNGCGITTPTAMSAIGFAESQWILDFAGCFVPPLATLDITDPCNCFAGFDCDGDNINEFVSETITITSSILNDTWSVDLVTSDAASIFATSADACAGTSIAGGTAVETPAGSGIYEFTFLKPVGVEVNVVFTSPAVGTLSQLTTACDACVCSIDPKDYQPNGDKDCVYVLTLRDNAANGWDAASIDVSVAEGTSQNYKVTVADGLCLEIPIYVNDGEFIDLEYWVGAFSNEHHAVLYDALGNVAQDVNGTNVEYYGTIPSTSIRVKAECPLNTCADATEDFTVRITMGFFPEEQSWEIYEGATSTTAQGPQVIGINANAYAGLAPGFQLDYSITLDKCQDYTFVAFDGANNAWDIGTWELITTNLNYGEEITNPLDSRFGESLVISSSDPDFFPGLFLVNGEDEDRVQFTIACEPSCTDVSVTNADGLTCSVDNVVLPISAPEVCYPDCSHAEGCDIEVQHFVLVNGVDYSVVAGSPITGTGSVLPTSAPFEYDTDNDGIADATTLPVGAHQYVTKYTYCDGVMVKCTADLNIVTDTNPTLTCNDNVIVSLAAPSSSLGQYTFGECVVQVTPDMVLEDTNICEGEYTVTVLDANDNPLVVYGVNNLPLDINGNEILPGQNTAPANNLLSPAELMETLTYVVEHNFSGNKCWGTISVEDKLDPVVIPNNYEIPCTHPEALNENWTHTDVYEAPAAELPANIAGGGGLAGSTVLAPQSNTFIPINMPCAPMGEIIQNIQVNLNLTHNDVTDLSVVLHLPAALDAALGNISPLALDATGDVGAVNVYTPNPVDDAPSLLGLLGAPCMLTQSTSPEDFVTENSGTLVPANAGGTWYIQVIDNSGTSPIPDGDPPFGGGEVTAASITLTCGFPTPVFAFDCSLEGTPVLLDETVVDNDCSQGDWLGSTIERIWQATDKFGRTTTATQVVGLKAPTFDAINMPGDFNVECTDQTPEDLTIEVTGLPTFACNDLTADLHGLCDITYTTEDLVIATCGSGYKIIRTWTVINWCSGTTKYFEQLIKNEDTQGPIITQDDIVVAAAAYDCSADVTIEVGVEDNCSGVSTVTASYTEGGGAYLGSNTLVVVNITNGGTLTGLPLGTTEVTIAATDACLNVTEELVLVTVEDQSVPVAICDDELHVSLGGDGTAIVDAEDIDEGSYDNCGDVTLEVRRTDGCLGQSAWGPTVDFACCDSDELVTVELRVTDAAGNTNICWKQILVEDALAPYITAPADITLDCNDTAVHAPFGEPTYGDNCSATIDFVDGGELDQCKAGRLTRTWTASDASDKSADAEATQTVTVEHVSDFVVQFPADVTINNCTTPGNTGEPTITNVDCELIATSSEDVVLTIVNDACYKIERTWTIINWCNYEEGAANTDLGIPQPLPRTYRDDDGYFTYVQTIKVLDNEAPVITNCPDDLVFADLTDGCEGFADLSIEAEDACSDVTALEYTYKIDAFNDGSFDIVNNGSNDASGVYPYGTHLIKWIVEDGCGNTSACSYLFTIEDAKNPTPVCLNGITIENMQTGCVDIWASDLLEYAFDNCTDVDFVENSVRMRIEGSTAAPTSALTLCCEDLGVVFVEIWVEDEAGNADYCTTYIVLQDNQGSCPDNNNVSVAGTVATEDGEMVENTNVDIDGGMIADMNTSDNGEFAFDVPSNNDYTVTPTNDNDPLNGVSTFDLVLMSQHILGINELASPYSLIAADVNNDGNITTFDVVQTRQLILYVITDFPANTSWRFVDADYAFPAPTNPWMETFPEAINYNNLSVNEMATDFVGVKIGDVNGDAVANSLLGAEDRNMDGAMILNIDDAEVKSGSTIQVDFRANDFNAMNGYQFTLNVEGMTFAGVEAGALNVTERNFGFTMLNEGVITTSWNSSDAVTVRNEEVLFTMNFVANETVVLSDAINVSSRYTTAEAYTGNDLMNVELAFNNATGAVSASTFELYQNTPNPFNGETMIGFDLPAATSATLKVFDVSGKVLTVVEGDFAKGYNTINLNSENLNAAGVVYYQLETPTNSATMKMIIIE